MENNKRLGHININEVLLEVLDSQAQHDDVELSGGGDSLDKENTWRKADVQELSAGGDILELFAGGSNSQRKTNAAAEPTNRKIKSEEESVFDQTKSKTSEKIKVHPLSKSSFSEVKNGAE